MVLLYRKEVCQHPVICEQLLSHQTFSEHLLWAPHCVKGWPQPSCECCRVTGYSYNCISFCKSFVLRFLKLRLYHRARYRGRGPVWEGYVAKALNYRFLILKWGFRDIIVRGSKDIPNTSWNVCRFQTTQPEVHYKFIKFLTKNLLSYKQHIHISWHFRQPKC